ncbi:MAG: hypothetical protein HY952_03325 [Elusimicrobia bacterium]|nr:hypothetical protein [Elusimicrobiota bacterium]
MARKRKGDGGKPLKRPPESPAPRAQASFPAEDPAGEGEKSALAPFFWAAAVILIVSGYLFLKKADPGGSNAWSVAAPACLLAGYLLIIPAIIVSYRGKG